jgi:uracil phosphoribosyltransferase
MIHIFNQQDSFFSVILAELRSTEIQQDRMRFRKNLERFGALAAYEISKKLSYETQDVITPLGMAPCRVIQHQPVVASVLRAGLPVHQGVLETLDRADNAFISAYRKHHKGTDKFEVMVEYLSSPSIDGRELILCDPMLATGSSMVLAYKAMLQKGKPSHIHVLSVIASQEGVNFVKSHLPANTTFWIGAVDEELTAQAYIVPGLGDAGDLAYGEKH